MLPNLAARIRPTKVIAAALVLGVGLVGVVTLRGSPAPTPPIACTVAIPTPSVDPVAISIPTPPIVPDANAADLVGIYRSAKCELTLDASGTYVSNCRGRHHDRYATSGQQVVLGDAQRLTISGRGRLVAEDGTIYSITGGTR